MQLAQRLEAGQPRTRYLLFMRWWGASRTFAVACASAGMVACGFTGEGTGDRASSTPAGAAGVSPEGGSDGGGTGDVFLDGGVGADAFVEGGGDASGCVAVPLDAFASGSWDRLESASIDGSGRAVLTTASSGSSAGAICWKAPITFTGRLHVVLDYAFDLSAGAQGDGLTVAWIPTTKKYVIGPQGQSYGICNAGLAGVAASVDTRDDQLVMVGDISVCETNTNVTTSTLLTSRRITVDITPTQLTATLDTGITLTRTKSLPTTGYLGFTAATGTTGETGHVLTAVSASVCP